MSSGELLSYTNLKKLIVLQCKSDLGISNLPKKPTQKQAKIVLNILDKSYIANDHYKIRYKIIPNQAKTSDFYQY